MFREDSYVRLVIDNTTVKSFPVVKPQFGIFWFCRLKEGEITVNYNQSSYKISSAGCEQCFMLVDFIPFFIQDCSDRFRLEIVQVGQDCMGMVYPFLGTEVNSSIGYDSLVLSGDMDNGIAQMINLSFNELWSLTGNELCGMKEKQRLIIHELASCMILFYNSVLQTIDSQRNLEKSTQSFRIMSQLEQLFRNEESFRHRDAAYFAEKLNISTRYFYNVCMKETGMSSKDFINDVIIGEIKNRLLMTSLSFQQISQLFAFPDQTAFTQYFKRNTGMTPTDYCRRYK